MSGVTSETVGSVGYLTLSRSATLNAITQDMVDELHKSLRKHEENTAINFIVLRSSSDRAFCAGGDMKRIRELALNEDRQSIEHFFTTEYALNLAIANCSKPYISVIDGVAMGGGLGLSVHGQFVVATENALMAMPESRIGFFPDVGASHFLQKLPNSSGVWLALTASPVKAQNTVQVGLATHYMKREQIPTLLKKLETLTTDSEKSMPQLVQMCLDEFSESAVDKNFEGLLQQRGTWFSCGEIAAIKTQLKDASAHNEDAAKLLALLDKGSPYSYAITLELFNKTKGMTLQNCLVAELDLSMQAAFHPDLVEGVRAVLVDKDHKANWA